MKALRHFSGNSSNALKNPNNSVKKSRKVCQKVLNYLDSKYESLYSRESWQSVREQMLLPEKPYCAFINAFSPEAREAESRLVFESNAEPMMFWPHNKLHFPLYVLPQGKKFPRLKHSPLELKPYFALNAASILPVDILMSAILKSPPTDVSVLDLCAAPGGKSLLLLNFLLRYSQSESETIEVVVDANEAKEKRFRLMSLMFESHLKLTEAKEIRDVKAVEVAPNLWLRLSNNDAAAADYRPSTRYSAVLADVPCSADRSWLFNDPSFSSMNRRLAEAPLLPQLHLRILNNALRSATPGGVVIYCTCTLDAAQNQDVVAMSDARDDTRFQILDLSHVKENTGDVFGFIEDSDYQRRVESNGILVIPQKGKSWGPMFISAIRKL